MVFLLFLEFVVFNNKVFYFLLWLQRLHFWYKDVVRHQPFLKWFVFINTYTTLKKFPWSTQHNYFNDFLSHTRCQDSKECEIWQHIYRAVSRHIMCRLPSPSYCSVHMLQWHGSQIEPHFGSDSPIQLLATSGTCVDYFFCSDMLVPSSSLHPIMTLCQLCFGVASTCSQLEHPTSEWNLATTISLTWMLGDIIKSVYPANQHLPYRNLLVRNYKKGVGKGLTDCTLLKWMTNSNFILQRKTWLPLGWTKT
jgi:hypothetical protein